VLVNELPGKAGIEVTAINFGAQGVEESVAVHGAAPGAPITDVLDPGAPAAVVSADGSIRLHLNAHEGRAFKIGS
jgi:hypothetical protein